MLNNLGLGIAFTATDLASGVMGKVRNGFSQTRNELGQFGMRSKEEFKKFGVGMGIMAAGLGGLAILGTTIDDAAEFQKAIALVATEADQSKFSMDQMSDIAVNLGKQFGRMPTDEAGALYKAVALGADDATKATYILTAANQLAVAGNADLKATMDALGGTLNAYHLGMDHASEVSDAFFIAMKNGNTTVQDLASSIGRVGAGANEMGISVQETLAAVSVMTNKGIQASEAVSMLHGALANITHPSKEAKQEAAKLGVQFDAAAVRSKGFVSFLHSITDSSKFSKDSLSKLFTSVEGSNAMAMLAGDMSAVDTVMGKMRTETGATKAGFDIMSETLSFQGDRFKAIFAAVKIGIGQVLEPIAARTLGFASKIMEAFDGLPKPIKDTIIKVAIAAGAFMSLTGALIAGLAAFKIVGAYLLTFGGGALGFVAASILPVVALMGVLAATFYALKFAYDENLGGLGDTINGAMKKISLAWRAIVQVFKDGAFSGAVLKELEDGNEDVENFAVRVYVIVNRVQEFFSALVNGIKEAFDKATPVFTRFSGELKVLFSRFGALGGEVDEFGNKAAFEDAGNKGFAMGEKIGGAITKIVDALSGAIKFVNDFTAEFSALEPQATSVSKSLENIQGSLKMFGLGLGESKESTSSWGSGVAKVFATVAQIAAGLVEYVSSKLAEMTDLANGFKALLTGDVKGAEDATMASMKHGMESLHGFAAIRDGVNSLMGSTTNYAGDVDKRSGEIQAKLAGNFVSMTTTGVDMARKTGLGETFAKEKPMTEEESKADLAAFMASHGAMNGSPPAFIGPQKDFSNSPEDYSAAFTEAADGLKALAGQPVVSTVNLILDGEVLATAQAQGSRSVEGRTFGGVE